MYFKYEQRQSPFFAKKNLKSLSPLPHIHQHLELIYLFEGEGVAVADHCRQILRAGDLYLSFPNQIHYYLAENPVKGCLIIVSPDLFPELKSIFDNRLPESPVVPKADLPPDTAERLVKICDCLVSDSRLMQVAANGYMQSLLAEVLQKMTLTAQKNDQDSVRKVLLYCLENYTEPLTLELLSSRLHLNKYYISHIFSDRVDVCFAEFINRLRVEHACRQVAAGDTTVTEAAYGSGFNSIRSFNRNFRRYTGMTPTQYLKQK